MIGLHDTRNQTYPSAVSGPAEDSSCRPPSCSSARPQRKLWRLLAHLTPCLGHAFLTPLEQLLASTSAICLGIVLCLGVSSSHSDLVPRPRDFAASVPALCLALLKRKADGPFILTWNWHFPDYLWKGTCGPPVGTMQAPVAFLWAQCKCLHCCLVGVSLQASMKGVCPSSAPLLCVWSVS